MPLHRNKVGQLKTMAFPGAHRDVFVKENYSLSRERCTVMTCISSSNAVPPPPPEFLFKGAGKKVTLAKFAQWAEKGLYRLENMLQYIETLPHVMDSTFTDITK